MTTKATRHKIPLGIVAHCIAWKSDQPNGITNRIPNKNTQLITVMGLYFCIRGFTSTRYTAYEEALINTIILPQKCSLFKLSCPPLVISTIAPKAPKATPIPFFSAKSFGCKEDT